MARGVLFFTSGGLPGKRRRFGLGTITHEVLTMTTVLVPLVSCLYCECTVCYILEKFGSEMEKQIWRMIIIIRHFFNFYARFLALYDSKLPIIGTIFPILDDCVHDAGQASLEKSGCCAIQMRGTRLCQQQSPCTCPRSSEKNIQAEKKNHHHFWL